MVHSFKGFTTGTTATAATLAAVQMLVKQSEVLQVKLTTPAQHQLVIPIRNGHFTATYATCSVMKESEAVDDVTNGIEITASVTWRHDQEIVIFGGDGVGVVVKEGLQIPIGEVAISPVPRRMMLTAARSQIGYQRGVNITLTVPKGRILSKVTNNVESGVEGGISILGTSGIITQCSEYDLKQFITTEIQQAAKRTVEQLVIVADDLQSECISQFLSNKHFPKVYISHHLEHALKIAQQSGIKKVTLIGNLSQLMKLSVGIFNIHSKNGHPQNEILLAHLGLIGADTAFIKRINQTTSLAKKIRLIQQSQYQRIFDHILDRVQSELKEYMQFHDYSIQCNVVFIIDEANSTSKLSQSFAIEYSRTI